MQILALKNNILFENRTRKVFEMFERLPYCYQNWMKSSSSKKWFKMLKYCGCYHLKLYLTKSYKNEKIIIIQTAYKIPQLSTD